MILPRLKIIRWIDCDANLNCNSQIVLIKPFVTFLHTKMMTVHAGSLFKLY